MTAINVQLYFAPQDRFDGSNGIKQVSISRALRSASQSILLPIIGGKSDSLRAECVTIKCYSSDTNNPVLQEICVKVKDLQVALNLGKSEIRRAKKKGTLEELVYNKIPQVQLYKENRVSTPSKITGTKNPVHNTNKLTLSLRPDPVLTLLEPENILPPESDLSIPKLINPLKIKLLLRHRYSDFKLTFDQFMELYRYFYLMNLDQSSQSRHFSKHALGIERSLLYIAEGVFKGPYIILKDRDKGVEDLGDGLSRVSYAMNFEGQLFAFKSTSSKKVKMMEWIVNDVLMETHENFVVGQYIEYMGRTTEEDGVKINEKKVGVLLPLMEGGDLLDYYNSVIVDKKSVNKIVYPFAFQLAEHLAALHEKNIVHLDLKLENILLDKSQKRLKIADFGLSTFRKLLTVPVGSPGFVDPTLVFAGRSHPQFYNDIWSFGIIVSTLKHGSAFDIWTEQREGNFDKLKNISQSDYDAALDKFLPNRHNKDSIDWIIDKCLRLDPNQRPTAKQVAEFLRKLIQKREAISPLR